jgi:hypothetical protein
MKRRRSVCWLTLLLLTGCAQPVSVYGLRPEYPKPRLEGSWLSTGRRADFVEVDSLRPTLRWEPFPDSDDRKADHEGMLNRVRNVTYDLKILRAESEYPAQVIYTRSGLPEPSHRPENPLEPSAKYFWTVRARFELDGLTRVTPWGRIRGEGSTDMVVPSPFYFGLKTPSQ